MRERTVCRDIPLKHFILTVDWDDVGQKAGHKDDTNATTADKEIEFQGRLQHVPETQHHVSEEEVQVSGTSDSSWISSRQSRGGTKGNKDLCFFWGFMFTGSSF